MFKASIINCYPNGVGYCFSPELTQPPLLAIYRSKHLNMDVVRFFVEEIDCNVNIQAYLRVLIRDTPTGYGICKHETPIHALFRGETHWWQGSEALPYFSYDCGVDLEIKDCFQSIPLVVVVVYISRLTFNQCAFKKLLNLGADAKAVDLRWASDSSEMIDLLLSYGAMLKPAAFLAAVKSRNCDVLNILILRGRDVNARQTITDGEDTQAHRQTPIYIETSAPRREIIARTDFERHLRAISQGPQEMGTLLPPLTRSCPRRRCTRSTMQHTCIPGSRSSMRCLRSGARISARCARCRMCGSSLRMSLRR